MKCVKCSIEMTHLSGSLDDYYLCDQCNYLISKRTLQLEQLKKQWKEAVKPFTNLCLKLSNKLLRKPKD